MTYCRTLTNRQLENVLLIEYARYTRGEDDSLYYEAREECCKRGIDPDTMIMESGVITSEEH